MNKNSIFFMRTMLCACAMICLQNAYGMGPIYRKAELQDLEDMTSFYSTMDKDGGNNVVVYPKEIIRGVFEADIKKGRMFVANNGGQLMSCLKVCHMNDEKDLNETLVDELNIGKQQMFQEIRHHEFDKDGAVTSKSGQDQCGQDAFVFDVFKPLVLNKNRCMNLYYGRAYTLPDARGKGICSQLLCYALQQVMQPMSMQNYDAVTLSFGLVDANKTHTYMFKSLYKQLCALTEKKAFTMRQAVYTAYRPDLTFNVETKKVEATFPEKNKGCGNIVVVPLSQHKKGDTL